MSRRPASVYSPCPTATPDAPLVRGFLMSAPICITENCDRPRAVLMLDGKRKRAKRCRRHLPSKLRRYIISTKRACAGENVFGKPCQAGALTPGRVVVGISVSGDYCMAHEPLLQDPDVPAEGRFRPGAQPNAGRPRRPKKTELVLQMIEDAAADLISEQMRLAVDAQKAVVVGNGMHAEIEMTPDVTARLRAIDSLLDRLMGRARTTTEIIGGSDASTPEVKRVPRTEDRATAVAEILGRSGAVSHQGRRRAAPSKPASAPQAEPEATS